MAIRRRPTRPYRLPELLQYPDATTFICEGEKDAGAVAALNLCATTVAGGKWTDDCVKALAGRDIIILEDADAAGRKKALAAAHALHGSAATIRIVRLPGLTGDPFNKDASDWLDADSRNAGKLVDVCFDVPIWEPSNPENGTEEAAENTSAESEDGTATEPGIEGKTEVKEAPLSFIRLIDWHNRPVPEREWVVVNRVPLKNVTLLSGEGSVGKTILSLQLCVATVLARDWIGAMPDPGPVVAICCEDDADELHRRLDAIVRHYGVSFADLADLHVLCLAGQDALLTTARRDGLMTPTKLFTRVTDAAATIKPRLILLDNSADVFGGDENDRAQVRQFIGMLRGLAMAANAGLLLTSHPSLTGIATGTGQARDSEGRRTRPEPAHPRGYEEQLWPRRRDHHDAMEGRPVPAGPNAGKPRETRARAEGRRAVPDIAEPLERAGPQRQREAQGQQLRAGPLRRGTRGQGRPRQ
jgi:hypothetical protein